MTKEKMNNLDTDGPAFGLLQGATWLDCCAWLAMQSMLQDEKRLREFISEAFKEVYGAPSFTDGHQIASIAYIMARCMLKEKRKIENEIEDE